MIPNAQEWQTGGLLLRCGSDGLLSARTAATGGELVAAAGSVSIGTAAGPLELGPARVDADADEVEVTRSGGGLRAVVRHSFEPGWAVRVLLVSTADEPLPLTRVHLGWRAAAGTVVTALGAGAAALHTIQPVEGDGPVLAGRLRSGTQTGADQAGLELGPLVLQPGHRWAAQWRWELVGAPRSVDPAGAFPRTLWLEDGQAVVLPAGPDVAVVAPGVEVEQDEDGVRLEAWTPGAATVELRAVRGTTTYGLTWAPALADAVDVEVEALLTGRTTPSGTARLPDAAGALLVQDALRRRSQPAPEEARDALELAGGLLLEELAQALHDDPFHPVLADPFAVVLLAREADRDPGAGARAFLDVASRAVLATRRPGPGTALAGVAVALALVRAGTASAERVVGHLAGLLDGADPTDPAGLELALLLGAGSDVVEPGLRRLGAGLGAGVPGRVVPEPDVQPLGHAATLLGLVDEATGQRLRPTWGVTASELARRTGAQVRARAAAEPDPTRARRALAWLVLGPPPADA